MKTQEHTIQQKDTTSEQEFGGLSMAPPAFKLTASDKSTAQADQEAEKPEVLKRSIAANFGLLSFQIINSEKEAGISPILVALEALKRNRRQTPEFLNYFEGKTGKGLFEFLAERFGKGPAEQVRTLLDLEAEVDEFKLVNDFHAAISEESESRLLTLLIQVGSMPEFNLKYKTQYPGEDLITTLSLLGEDMPLLKEMLEDKTGGYQNYELLAVRNSEEATEARLIIARIFDQYHIEINSQEVAHYVRELYKSAPQEQKDQVKTSDWTLEELQQIELALSRYAPILGTERYESSRSEDAQEVRQIGRVNQRIGEAADGSTVLDSRMGGTSYIGNYIVAMFDNARSPLFEKDLGPGADARVTGFGATATHELGHQFFQYALHDFKKEMKYWFMGGRTLKTKKFSDGSGKVFTGIPESEIGDEIGFIEMPATEYALTNPLEDLAETVTLYFTDQTRLLNGSEEWKVNSKKRPDIYWVGNPCPERAAFIEKKIAAWKSEEK